MLDVFAVSMQAALATCAAIVVLFYGAMIWQAFSRQ